MMRCFPACFRASKQQKYHKSLNAIPSQHQSNKATEAVPSTEYINQEKAVKPITGSKAEVKEELNNDFKKRVIFDLNVEAKEEPSYKEVDNSSNLVENNEENKERNRKVVEPILDFIASSKTASFTLNHRKHVSDAEIGEKEVSSPMPVDKVVKTTESCPNARNRSQYVHSVLNPIENLSQWKELQEGSKPSPPPLKKHYQGKENSSLDQYISISFSISPEPSFKLSDPNLKTRSSALKPVEHEIGVETSLSSWLVESETTPKSNGSNNSVENFRSGKENTAAKSHEDRPILGAWTVEELKQFSTSSSPRRLRSQSPDETPIIGTVGSYWIHTGQKLDYSDSSSSCGGTPITPARDIETIEVKVHCIWAKESSKPIPFEARLERACDMGVSEA
ncbi:hypothetical protein FEM48_Zijuj02G0172300 [Ziziphus jujuba var. spinosa]|uniref:Protein JASON-like n=1 Tax=Ziziphus jujuba var. spinosa TaxID=714518 RepID=A0A978VWX9_ZIZJJ|nr:hypothetical protein FEM48_Zijuj02G0172300 [Ziziphus jujuba var. spinosa]